jgi:hypothetical protein
MVRSEDQGGDKQHRVWPRLARAAAIGEIGHPADRRRFDDAGRSDRSIARSMLSSSFRRTFMDGSSRR